MKLFCSSSTNERFTDGEFYDAQFNGRQFHVTDNTSKAWSALYEDDSGFIVIEMVGGDFVEFE